MVRNHLGGTAAVLLRDLGGNPLRVYLRAGSGSWSWIRDEVRVGRLAVLSVYASGVEYVHSDHLGSPRKITDSSGNVVASNDFYPYSLPAATTGLQNSWSSGYESEHQNTASTYTDDVYFLHARWYFPQLARFLSPDPVRGNPAVPQSFNLFAYVGGNPVNMVDPTGLRAADFELAPGPGLGEDCQVVCHDFVGGTREDREAAYRLQEELRRSLTAEVVAWFREQFGVDLDEVLRPGRGITFVLTKGTPGVEELLGAAVVGMYVPQSPRGYLNTRYFDLFGSGGKGFMATLIHETAHWARHSRTSWSWLKNLGSVGVNQRVKALYHRELGRMGYGSGLGTAIRDSLGKHGREGWYAELYQFGEIVDVKPIAEGGP